MLTAVAENAFIRRLVSGLPRSPLQLNRLQESDAEILTVPGTDGIRLAITVDTLAEEIRTGLYAEPWLIGWMTVTASLSDLAAVGAMPLGILVAETIPPTCPDTFLRRMQAGIADACRACGTSVLGGDTNSGEALSLTGCALGLLVDGNALTRVGCAPGETLFASGPIGSGNAFALAQLICQPASPTPYRANARVVEGQMLRPFATACMDTSDGLLATLDQLMRLNGTGFALESGWPEALDGSSRDLLRACGLPEWLLLAGPHGEFELLFTIPPEREQRFLVEASRHGWHPLRLGGVIPEAEIRLATPEGDVALDTGAIRNLAPPAGGDFSTYLNALRAIGERRPQRPDLESRRE